MTEEKDQKEADPIVANFWQFLVVYSKQYGAFMFSIVVAIAMWYTMAKPEIDRNQINVEAIRQMMSDMSTLSNDMNHRGERLEKAAELLERATERIARERGNGD